MTRINEALQRAAEEQATTSSAAETTAVVPAEGQDVSTLVREPFPVEIGERRRRMDTQPEKEAEPSRVSEQEATDPAGDAAPRSRSVFERIDARLAEKVVADANMSPISREQYRRLAGVLLDAQSSNGLRVVMIASAVPGEGKTLTASNVAMTLSESYRRRVLLIDADLRKPTLHQVFRLNAASGLIDGLESQNDTKLVLRQVSSHLSVLPAGRPTSDPMAALTSDRMRRLLEEAKETFDWIIVDTPPLMMLPDAHLLASTVDGAVLVVKANSTQHDFVKRTADIIGRSRIVGVVLNHAEEGAQPGYQTYYSGYYLRGEAGPLP